MADFFDKMFAGIGKGVSAVGAGSKAMMEKNNINGAMKKLDEERGSLAEHLGMKIFAANKEGNVADEKEIQYFCTEISKRLEAIAECTARLRSIEEEAAAAAAAQVSQPGQGVYTAICKCGNVNLQGAKFCAKCGERLPVA